MGVPRERSTEPGSLCVKRCRKRILPLISRTPSGGQTWCCAAHTSWPEVLRSMAPSQHDTESAHEHQPDNLHHLQRHTSTAQRRRAGVVLRRLCPSLPLWKDRYTCRHSLQCRAGPSRSPQPLPCHHPPATTISQRKTGLRIVNMVRSVTAKRYHSLPIMYCNVHLRP